ncbi:glycoside hydrolase family 88 protein [Jiangella asiatica]|uniref:Glycosyl hydrolase n=1 Tax=Jiangella asiatica TaxID=2530372 RepID=A0A4R5DUU2_9ACTN|nr:glycoside hydrolase family 88 protein [Jiangella asiatica]TDE14985.1 hypothetical protein E1269_02415 [Jiangella asiatica]
MFRFGDSVNVHASVERPLAERLAAVGYAAMGYWFYRWDWGEAIALDGLLAASRALDNPAYTTFAVTEAQRWADEAGTNSDPNPFGPAGVLLDAVEGGLVRDDSAALDCLRRYAENVRVAGSRVGALAHQDGATTGFVDSLYGMPELLARLGRRLETPAMVDDAVALSLGHCRLLQSERSGLFAHFAEFDGADGARIAWGRGNGWAVLGLSDLVLAVAPETPGADELTQRFVAMLDGLRATQEPGGWWRNILDDPASYPEASTSLMVVAAVTQAVRSGRVDARYLTMADAAWSSLEHRVDANGHVAGVSYRPGLNADPARYEHTPLVGAYPWGQGPYLRAACQRLDDTAAPTRAEGEGASCSP